MKNKSVIIISVVAVILAIGAIFAFSSNNNSSSDGGSSNVSSLSVAGGRYTNYTAQAVSSSQTNSVLFFHASWCPNCRALEKDILDNASKIPDDLRILKVDFDSSNDLKQKYGITMQHTLVLVDNTGEEIKKASGIFTLQDIVSFNKVDGAQSNTSSKGDMVTSSTSSSVASLSSQSSLNNSVAISSSANVANSAQPSSPLQSSTSNIEGGVANNNSVAPQPSLASTTPGVYTNYTPQAVSNFSGNSVLFFHANWCPNCKALDSDINKNLSDIPSDINVLKVDYDNSSDLKQKYGVTVQHTLVLVDKSGNQIKKANGIFTLDDIIKFAK